MFAVVVDDRMSFAPMLARRLETCGASVRCTAHGPLVRDPAPVLRSLGPGDLVMVDAVDIGATQDDPRASRLGSLDVLALLGAMGSVRPRVVVYSTSMADPAVNIPLRTAVGRADAYYEVVSLLDELSAVVEGSYRGQVAVPSAADYSMLDPDLPSSADVGAAHQRMRVRDLVWEQVWNPGAPFDRAAQRWISRNVLPLLLLPSSAGYAVAVDVIRRVSGLPR